MKVSEHEYYNWYVLFTAFHAEKKVKRQLDAAGIGSYLPFKISRFQWQNIEKEMSVPAVARCIFVYLSNGDLRRLTAISSLLLPIDLDDCRLSDKQMENVRLLFSEGNASAEWVSADDVSGRLQVQVISGVHQGLTGELLQDTEGCSVLIRLNKIVNFRVSVAWNELERI